MRVIGGDAKGRKLKRVPGDTTRPVTDRVKENLFNILGDWVIDTVWLDLFAGTGQVGIEALSRGAKKAVFVENSPAAIKVIRDNLKHTDQLDNAVVLRRDALLHIEQMPSQGIDVIYVAPPQYRKLWVQVLQLLDREPNTYLTSDGMIIVQIDPKEFVEASLKNLILFDQRRYGNTMLCFYEEALSRLT